MAPVGPETWTSEPPRKAATSPATIAVVSPAAAPETGGDAEGEGQRESHDGDGQAGDDIASPRVGEPAVVGPLGEEAPHPASSARPARRSWVSRSEVSRRALAVARRSTTSGSFMA